MLKVRLILITLIAAFSSCRVGPEHCVPVTDIPLDWHAAEAIDEEDVILLQDQPLKMWELFDDPLFACYLDRIANENLDVRLALAKVYEAYALRQISFAKLLPIIDNRIAYNRAKPAGGVLEGGGIPSGDQPFAGIPLNLEQETFIAEFDAVWEVDLFGKARRGVESASAFLEMEFADYCDAIVAVTAEFGRTYLELRRAQKNVELLNREIDALRKKIAATQQRLSGGLDVEIQSLQAQIEVDQLAAQTVEIESEILPLMYRLSFLLGKVPEELVFELQQNPGIPEIREMIPVGFPSDLLRRRPDIRFAERQIAKTTADVGVAVAELFPKLTLTGSYGYQYLQLGDAKGSGSSWGYGGSLLTPIFHGGSLRANIHRAQWIRSEAFISYEQTVLTALQESESAIARFLKSRDSLQQQESAYKNSLQILRHTRSLYENGLSNTLDLISSERQALQAERDWMNQKVDSEIELIALYKALGGSWECCF